MVTTGFNKLLLEAKAVEQLRSVFDPEIPVNIYDLGLVYGILIDDDSKVVVKMTLTSPTCPVAGTLPIEVENKIKELEGITDAVVELVWDPPWGPDMMSEEAKLSLNLF